MIQVIDAHALLAQPERPIEWAIDGLAPTGAVMDVFGPPGAGKTTLLTDFAMAWAAEAGQWHGRAIQGGPAVILGGERTDRGALQRDLRRTHRPSPEAGALTLPVDKAGDCPPIWAWDRRALDGAGAWRLTPWGAEVTDWLGGAQPKMVIIDTVISAAAGCDLLDQPQQYMLGLEIRQWAKRIGATLTVTVSHTNQASAGQDFKARLDYLSRAGGNGFPGALRQTAGLTKLMTGLDAALAAACGLDKSDESLFLFGFSKHNETPRPDWTNHAPAIFTQRTGQVEMVMSGEAVRLALRAVEALGPDQAKPKAKPKSQKQNEYARAKDGQSAAMAGGDDDWE